jgi:peptidase E
MSVASPAPMFLLAGRPKGMPRRNRCDPLLRHVIESRGAPHPSVAYLGSASGDHREFFSMISGLLKDAGAGVVSLARTAGAKVDIGKTREILENADVILVSGGDVEEGMRVLGEKNLTPLLREHYEAGTVFAGLSAGSIMLSRQWVRWRDPDDDSTAEVFACMGLAPVLCDTHGEDEYWEELLALLRVAGPGAVGHGIPSGSALCVTAQGQVSALGEPVRRFINRDGVVARMADLESREFGCEMC